MSNAINNPRKFATNDEPESSAFSPSGIIDDTDFPHTGLIKALNRQAAGNVVVSGFNLSGVTATSLDVGAGVVLKDGKRESVVASSGLSISNADTTGYNLLVVNDSLALSIRGSGGTTNKIPAMLDGDIIVAVLAHTGTNPMQVQYLTNWKTANSLSVAHDNNGTVYTQEGEITASTSGGIDIKTTTTNSDIRITPNGTGEVVFSSPLVTTSNGDLNLAPDGTGQILLGESSSADLQVTTFGQRALELSTNSGSQTGKITIDNGPNGDITIAPTGSGKIILNDGANAINFPTSDGNADEVLTTDGSGQLSFASVDLSSKQDAISGDTITTATVATDDKVLIQDTSDSDNLKTVTTQAIADLYVETQTLNDVTNEGATTSNNITVGDVTMGDANMSDATMNNATINTKLNLSKVGALDANADVIVQYIDASQNVPTAHQYTLPAASTVDGSVYIIKNLNASNSMNIVPSGSDVFENNVVSSDTRYVNTAQLTLKPLQSVMLQAINDAIVIPLDTPNALLSGWMILETDSDTDTGITDIVEDISPQLGAHLDVNGKKITSASNGDVEIEPHGTGDIILDGDVSVDTAHSFVAAKLPTATKTTSTLSNSDAGKYLFVSTTGQTITLPASPVAGEHYTILANGYDVTLSSSDNMNGSSDDITISSYSGVTCISDGTNWIVLGA